MLQTWDQPYPIFERFSGYITGYTKEIINYVVNSTLKYFNPMSYLINYTISIIDYVGNLRWDQPYEIRKF